MKKKISIILITFLLISAFASCSIESDVLNNNDQINISILKEYNDLLLALEDIKSIEGFDNYIMRWADKEDIKTSYDKFGNIIMSKAPTEGYASGNGNSINIQTSIDISNLEECCIPVAMSLFLIKNVTENNFMRIIFTNNSNGDFSGAKGINSSYLFTDNQINLDWTNINETSSSEFDIVIASVETTVNQMSLPLKYVDSTYSKAYKISINNLNGGSSSKITSQNPNPIKIIGDLLASCKSSGILFELGDFVGGDSPDTFPTSASITLVINDNDINKFTKKVENAQKKFKETYGASQANYTYLLTETEKPEKVLSSDNMNSIVSLLYTLVSEIYMRDETTGEIISTSSIGQISTLNNQFKLLICGRSISEKAATQLKDAYNIIASLSDVNYSMESATPIWEAKENNKLLTSMVNYGKANYNIEPKILKSFENTENAIFAQNDNLKNLISIKINMNNYVTQTRLLLDLITEKKPSE
jgi:dipeptidase D